MPCDHHLITRRSPPELYEHLIAIKYCAGGAKIRGYGTDAALGELSGEFAEPVVVLSGHEGAAPPVVRAATMNPHCKSL